MLDGAARAAASWRRSTGTVACCQRWRWQRCGRSSRAGRPG